ncbi:MAG: DUF488 family protein [Dehalococcoidia bacterium]
METVKTSNPGNIYTVGHSNVELDEFIALLNGIEVVVDVRSTPFSKYAPQFGMHNIRAKLRVAGIEYLFLAVEGVGNILGGQPRDDGCYENGRIVYERVMERNWYQEGIARLVGLAQRKSVAIMCSEEDPHRCHRHHLVAQTLLDRGVAVYHIRGDKSTEKAEKEVAQLTLL